MKRRHFLAYLVAPFVVKKAAANPDVHCQPIDWDAVVIHSVKHNKLHVEMCKRAGIDLARADGDRHSASVWKVGPGEERQMVDRWETMKESLPAWRDRMQRLYRTAP